MQSRFWRSVITLLPIWLVLYIGNVNAYSGPTVIAVENLSALAETVIARRIPIMLVVTQDYCGYCDLLKEEIIQPMLISGDYDNKVLIREIKLDSERKIKDFSGRLRRQGDITEDYSVWVTPTILFLGDQGQTLAEPMLGVNSLDYYGYYVDQAIDQSLSKLRD